MIFIPHHFDGEHTDRLEDCEIAPGHSLEGCKTASVLDCFDVRRYDDTHYH